MTQSQYYFTNPFIVFFFIVHIASIKVSVGPLCTLQMCGGHGLDLVDHSFQVLVDTVSSQASP